MSPQTRRYPSPSRDRRRWTLLVPPPTKSLLTSSDTNFDRKRERVVVSDRVGPSRRNTSAGNVGSSTEEPTGLTDKIPVPRIPGRGTWRDKYTDIEV